MNIDIGRTALLFSAIGLVPALVGLGLSIYNTLKARERYNRGLFVGMRESTEYHELTEYGYSITVTNLGNRSISLLSAWRQPFEPNLWLGRVVAAWADVEFKVLEEELKQHKRMAMI